MAPSKEVVGVISFYLAAALIMIFVNKIVLNSAPNLTILFMFFQSIMTVILLSITAQFTPHVEIPAIRMSTARNLAPLIAVDAASFMFNALCLRDVEAAFYQIARALVLPFTIALVAISGRNRPAPHVVGCALIVTLGFFMGATRSPDLPQRATPTWLALLYGLLSSLAMATHAVLIKSSLRHVDGSCTKLSYSVNLGAAVILGSVALYKGEVADFRMMLDSGEWDWTTFAWGNLVTGVFGFLISVAGILSIKVTSPVTHMFSSAAKSVLQVALGVKIFGDVVTTQRAASVFTILTGTVLYTYYKSRESSPISPAPVLPLKDLESNEETRQTLSSYQMYSDKQISNSENFHNSSDTHEHSNGKMDPYRRMPLPTPPNEKT